MEFAKEKTGLGPRKLGSLLALLEQVGAAVAGEGNKWTVPRYAPLPANLHVGDTITFVNKDTLPHTVTARDNSFNLRLPPGQSATLTLGKAGAFNFYCIYHPAMRGTLKVAA